MNMLRATYDLANGQRVVFWSWSNFSAVIDTNYLNQKYNEALTPPIATQVWDDQWYARRTPVGTFILMMACNVDVPEYRHVAIYNGPDHWSVLGGSHIAQGHDNFRKITTDMGGSRIDFDLWNPTNDGDMTSDDLIISFGY